MGGHLLIYMNEMFLYVGYFGLFQWIILFFSLDWAASEVLQTKDPACKDRNNSLMQGIRYLMFQLYLKKIRQIIIKYVALPEFVCNNNIID